MIELAWWVWRYRWLLAWWACVFTAALVSWSLER